MSWMPWQQPIKPDTFTATSPDLLNRLGKGVTFSYGTYEISKNLFAIMAFRETALVFLGMSLTQEGLQDVLKDAQSRSQWRYAQWVEVDAYNLSTLSPQTCHPRAGGGGKRGEMVPTRMTESAIETIELWGTPFQISVWQELLKIPPRHHSSYGEIAQNIGNPQAHRAVGTAVGANPISGYIPCHRVFPKSGGLGNYRWGVGIKEKLLGEEARKIRG
jgi:O-6-methylguanine DNA methyltransferase